MASIQIIPLAPDDWVVREEGGRELGHYPSQAEAETVGRTLARKRKVDLVIKPIGGRSVMAGEMCRVANQAFAAEQQIVRLLGCC